LLGLIVNPQFDGAFVVGGWRQYSAVNSIIGKW